MNDFERRTRVDKGEVLEMIIRVQMKRTAATIN